jgi:hypothetical protein
MSPRIIGVCFGIDTSISPGARIVHRKRDPMKDYEKHFGPLREALGDLALDRSTAFVLHRPGRPDQ